MTKITKSDLFREASGTFLTHCLPDKWEDMDESEQNDFIESNLWQPFEYHSGRQVFSFIDSTAYGLECFLKHTCGITIEENK